MKTSINFSRQHGVSLVVTLVLVILLSLLALYGAGVLVLDTRSAANDYRQREALAAAEAGLEQGYSLMSVHRTRIKSTGLDVNGDGSVSGGEPTWAACSASATTAPCVSVNSADRANWSYLTVSSSLTVAPTQGSFNLYWMTPTSGLSALPIVYYIVASGKPQDAGNTDPPSAIVKQAAYFYPVIATAPLSPIMTYGEIGGNGNYNVVTNPNGAGTGQPITTWSHEAVSLGGSAATCHLGEQTISGATGTGFLSSDSTYLYQSDNNGHTITMCAACTCPTSDKLSGSGSNGIDIVEGDTNFPDDVFKYLFGVSYTSYYQIKNNAQVLSDCSSLNTNSSGLIWVTGACSINASVGSFANPVLLVVQDSAIQISGGGSIFGLIFAFGSGGYDSTATNVHMAGSTTLYGAIMSNTRIDLGNGTYKMRFDKNTLENVSNTLSGRALARLPGSWSDVQ